MPWDTLIIRGGIVGMVTSRAGQQQRPGLKVIVLEKEPALCAHQTARNSGVIHSGIYYKPGSYKAKLCVAGNASIYAFARKGDIKSTINPRNIPGTLTSSGFHKLAAKLWRPGLQEVLRSFSHAEFVRSLQKLFSRSPSLIGTFGVFAR